MNTPRTYRIALLFKTNELYGREIVEGISQYLGSTRITWDPFLESDLIPALSHIEIWKGDGIIADFNDAKVAQALAHTTVPVVAVGCSYADPQRYPRNIPYVASDSEQLVQLAYDHLVEAGLTRFAMFGLPPKTDNRWAQEREDYFRKLMERDHLPTNIHRGESVNAPTWSESGRDLVDWLKALPKPVGIIAVNDTRARQLLQACTEAGIAVPAEISVIGIDNDPLASVLNRIPISSVVQGTLEMGKTAARLLHQILKHIPCPPESTLIAPVGVRARASTEHVLDHDPKVMRARHFIRQFACQGVRTEQVADYVGVSRSSLEAHFRQELQRSVHDEIMRIKLEAATSILSSESAPMDAIAVRCGFTSVHYMCAVFRRELGCTPGQFRNSAAPRGSVAFGHVRH